MAMRSGVTPTSLATTATPREVRQKENVNKLNRQGSGETRSSCRTSNSTISEEDVGIIWNNNASLKTLPKLKLTNTALDRSLKWRSSTNPRNQPISPLGQTLKTFSRSPPESKEELMPIQSIGKAENWYFDTSELTMEKEPFATGAYAKIYHGTIRGLDVCVKQVKNPNSKRGVKDLQREIALWRAIRHPNICLFIGATHIDSRGYMIVMEDMVGGDLKARINHMTTHAALKCGIEISKAIAWMHGNQPAILHRDIKPENILFDSHGTAKLSDFGLCRLKEFELQNYKMTGMTGTMRYMAPEILRSENYDETVDIYSFGLVMYYAFTQAQPFQRYDKPMRIKFATDHQNFLVSNHFKLDTRLANFIMACTKNDPAERLRGYQCVEFLQSFLQGYHPTQCCTIC